MKILYIISDDNYFLSHRLGIAKRALQEGYSISVLSYKNEEKFVKEIESYGFDFIELNSRYWAALNLDILAGIHFPCIHLDYFFEKLTPKTSIRLVDHVEVRNALPADFGYMLSSLKDPAIAKLKKVLIVIEFLVLFLNPKIKADLLYPNDRKLYFINLWAFTKEFTSACLKRLK